ncbi:aconitate hydratase AcnA [Corynebacterium glyciniphilum]|uniref:aconitate hydratase AcnA n=1 Tax=Corynebacterium glyciniphilum TaxID=1404244 RepID=UPI003DA117DD
MGEITVNGIVHRFCSASELLGPEAGRWPVVLRLLAENVGRCVSGDDRNTMLAALRHWADGRTSQAEIHFQPGRLLMHDTTSTPALVDMVAMRDELSRRGHSPETISPALPVEISVDHSLAVESYARRDAPMRNLTEEIRRNRERYRFLRWASAQMANIHINPPGTGIMHTINLEQLATVVTSEIREDGPWVIPDQMIGTDSHTPMINGLGVLGWGVGGLEAETVMFGLPTTMRIPDVLGVRLTGRLRDGVTATDLALVITHRLRELGVTGEFVEFFGEGVSSLSVGERAVVANMAPEYGATTGFFPVDDAVLDYLRMTGREEPHIDLVRTYCQATGLWFDPCAEPEYTRTNTLDLDTVGPSAAGPRRPQDHLAVSRIPEALSKETGPVAPERGDGAMPAFPVALAAITSCTNTTDPRLIITAGLVARRARELGLRPPSWVKTSLAPGSPAAVSYLRRAGLLEDLSFVGFDIVGFGCTTCIGNSGELPDRVRQARQNGTIVPGAVLSGNRNFPGRIHPDLDIGFLVSPALVVAFALTGDLDTDITTDQIGISDDGRAIRLADLWPSAAVVDETVAAAVDPADFAADFRVASHNTMWERLEVPDTPLFPWQPESTMLRPPPFARTEDDGDERVGILEGVAGAYPLLVLGDDITTDHISPAGAIPSDSAVAEYLVARGEMPDDLNVFASRRGNWEVMVRGAFSARAVKNVLAPGSRGAWTVHGPTGEGMPVWDAAERYRHAGDPVIVVAGDRYGMGSSRDWAAKAQYLLGVRAVLAVGFERIHRSNLIGMGILPVTVDTALHIHLSGPQGLRAGDTVDILPGDHLVPQGEVQFVVHRRGASGVEPFAAPAAVETALEVELLRAGGVIPSILAAAPV